MRDRESEWERNRGGRVQPGRFEISFSRRASRLIIKTCQLPGSLRAAGRSAHHQKSAHHSFAPYEAICPPPSPPALSLITKVSRCTELNCKLQFRFDIRAVTAWRCLPSLIRCYIRPAVSREDSLHGWLARTNKALHDDDGSPTSLTRGIA